MESQPTGTASAPIAHKASMVACFNKHQSNNNIFTY